ncbi:tripartite tricarboxylate transporter TctB family protein [Mesorhizobium sp. 1B3]|uniref:tripartite tricarboxylate transporter TctB family protein n=1 Tax=Mesorhizobium sp. 1B3 TaxID=3243599 RepID=UPI003D97418E
MKRLATPDAASGILFTALGALGVVLSLQEQIGTAARMGSGFLPLTLSCGLLALGLVIIASGLRSTDNEAVEIGGMRPVAMLLLAVAVFALSVRNLGLGPAVFLATLIACYAEARPSLLRVLAFALLLALFCTLVFIRGLGLTVPALVLPWIS